MDYLGASGRLKRQFQAVDVEIFEITSVYSRDGFDLKSPNFFSILYSNVIKFYYSSHVRVLCLFFFFFNVT